MLRVPENIVQVIEKSCTMNNVRGAKDWRSKNDGKGHNSNIMKSLIQARKAEWFVWKELSNWNVKNLTKPNFERDSRASADMSFECKNTGKKYYVEVKSCDIRKRDRNGYQFQIRRKTKHGIRVVDPYIRSNGEIGGDLLFFCVIVDGDVCKSDTIFGTPRKDLVCIDPNREDLKGLKYAIHPRLNDRNKNMIF
tara:strand:- start:1147 stop:1728 length:582 start_codon:yes stop_codon:yes gene_type:complete